MMKTLTDRELLEKMLSDEFFEDLVKQEQRAFAGMLDRLRNERELSTKQADWVHSTAERLGIQTAPAKNLFSRMQPMQRKEHEEQVRTQLPWEKPGYARPLKPPGKP
jgi:hypothetical protein